MPLHFDYYDVSDDRRAWRSASIGDMIERELRSEGFAPLGVSKAVYRANGAELLNQIWVADGGRVMTNGALELATLFEDGTIVKTSRRVTWSFYMRARWRLRMHRADRHPHAFVPGSLADALAAHREQVALFEKETPVVLAKSMAEHFAVRLRDAELREARERPIRLVALAITVIVSLAVACLPMVWLRMHGFHGPHERHARIIVTLKITALMNLAFFIAAIPVRYLTLYVIAPLVVTLRRGPPRRTAAAWMELARAIPPGKVDRDVT